MGNSFSGKRRTVKIMKVDGSMFKVKPPAQAMDVLRGHAGHTLLESEEVRRLGLRAKPLDPDAPLKPAKLYFLVQLPRIEDHRRRDVGARRARSGALHVGARERLESLMLTRRTMSDLYVVSGKPAPAAVAEEVTKDGVVRLRMRLPKAQVERLIQESKDPVEAAERIMELCAPRGAAAGNAPRIPDPMLPVPSALAPATTTGRKQKQTRFVAMPDEIIA